jgi:hypothetical protein
MSEVGDMVTVASIVAGFGVAMLFFRIQRELHMQKEHEGIWIPWADRLLIGATLISLLLVIIPSVVLPQASPLKVMLPAAASSASVVMVAGYIPAILAHYRLILGQGRTGPRVNPEPGEKRVVWTTVALAIIAFLAAIAVRIAFSTPNKLPSGFVKGISGIL